MMFSISNRIWRILSTSIIKYRANHSYCKCVQCEETYLKYKTRDTSVFSIKLTDSSRKTYRTKDGRFLLALGGILTWLGLKKEEDDPMISVIKLGLLNYQNKEFDKAETILHMALKLAQEREDMQAQTYIFDILANVAFDKGDFAKAEKLFIQVSKELLASGTSFEDNAIVEISLKLASLYSKRNEIEKAWKGFQFCISTQKAKVDEIDLSNVDALSQIDLDTVLLWAMSLDWYARFLVVYGKFKESKEYFEKALDISRKINGPSHPQTLVLFNDIGSVHALMQEYDLAIENFQKAIQGSDKESSDISVFYCNLGSTYLYLKNIPKAEEACKTALKLAKKLKQTAAEADATDCLEEVYGHKSK